MAEHPASSTQHSLKESFIYWSSCCARKQWQYLRHTRVAQRRPGFGRPLGPLMRRAPAKDWGTVYLLLHNAEPSESLSNSVKKGQRTISSKTYTNYLGNLGSADFVPLKKCQSGQTSTTLGAERAAGSREQKYITKIKKGISVLR